MKWFLGCAMFLLLVSCVPANHLRTGDTKDGIEIFHVVITLTQVDTLYRFGETRIQFTWEAQGIKYISYADTNVYVAKGSRAIVYLKK